MKLRTEFGERHQVRDPVTKERLDPPLVTRYVEYYTQPFLRYWLWKIYHAYDMRVFKIPGYNRLQDLDEWLHRRHCHDDCMTGEVRRRGEPSKIETFCAHMPLSARQDCRCHELSMKARVEVSREDIDTPDPGDVR